MARKMNPTPITTVPIASSVPEGKLKILVLIDSLLASSSALRVALEDQRRNFLESTQGRVTTEVTYQERPMGDVLWQPLGDYFHPSISWLTSMGEDWQRWYGDQYDFIQLVLDDSHWNKENKNNLVWGWNMGISYPASEPNYQVEIIRGSAGTGWIGFKRTFDMELVHAFDQLAAEKGHNLNNLFDVPDFDEDVVHGRDPRYNTFEYRHVYTKTVDILIELFPNKEEPMLIDRDKLNQIFNELLFRNPDPGSEGYIGKEEDFVRAEIGASGERAKLIELISSARNI